MARLPVGPDGVQMPLCESCSNKDCGNPVFIVDISVFGVMQKIKLHRSGSSFMAVINCDGYLSRSHKNDIDDF